MSVEKKPWPMKWVVLAIILFIAVYTVISLRFRRPEGSATQPYHDAKQRAVTTRLLSSGFRRVAVEASRPADPQRTPAAMAREFAAVAEAPGGLSEELTQGLVEKPLISPEYRDVIAPRETSPLLGYSFQFTCRLPDRRRLFASAHAYVKDQEVAIVATFDRLDGDLAMRGEDSTILVTIPGNTLPPGNYTVTLVGERESKRWTMQVH